MQDLFDRTHYCTDISLDDLGKTVSVYGFVSKQRDKGNLIFIDLRDRTGIVQLSFNSETAKEVIAKAKEIKSEYVIHAKGVVKKRESINNQIKTGNIEIFVTELNILSISDTTPFQISDLVNVNEELKLKYRYLDLRRPNLQHSIMMRHKITKIIRDYFNDNDFLEIETPMLIKSTPEGARDYLVPSRVHKGSFFALPQSPQIYKQLLMVSGFDRYMQIARCFRDEDLRSDRQPEFTQVDLEMSYVTQNDIISMNEGMMVYLLKNLYDINLKIPFKRLSYKNAMELYGSDKPDTRFDMIIHDLSKILSNSTFKVFLDVLKSSGSVRAILVKGINDKLTRKEIDLLGEVVKTYGSKGLAYSKLNNDGSSSSSYEKFLSKDEINSIRSLLKAEPGDTIFIVADDNNQIVFDSLGALRLTIANKYNLYDKSIIDLLWVTDFPLFEYSQEQDRYVSKHHPFTSVHDEDICKLETSPGECRAKAYDLIFNGCEVGGGSIRISNSNLQQKIFNILGFNNQEINERFGFLIDAFKYGVPPHGGMAYGLDRLVMLLLNKDSIRDVIAFPKVQNSSDLMTNCPSEVNFSQLSELGLDIKNKK